MGLIRKQAGFDLKVKIEKWINEYLGSPFRYTVRDDFRILAANVNEPWFTIIRLVRQGVEIPEYISFVFNEEIRGTLWDVNIEELVDILNKYPHSFHNLDRLTLVNYRYWAGIGDRIEILKIGGKFIKV